jgi:HSP20 family protein
MPSIDVTETDKEIEITAELPGLERKDIDISIEDDLLTIRGEKKVETKQEDQEDKDKNYHVSERS